ncbi:MAG: hypothetical protein AAF830_11325, partial [Pseudomonadota bacterium]
EAFVDGELTDDQRAEFEAAMASRPDIVASVAFYRELRRNAQSAAAQIDDQPLSPGLEKTLQRLAQPSFGDIVMSKIRALMEQPIVLVPVGAAAALAIFAVAVFGTSPQATNVTPVLIAGVDASEALITLADGEEAGLIRVRSSHVNPDGEFCRVAIVGGPEGAAGLLCWDDGQAAWRIDAEDPPLNDAGYVIAGAGDRVGLTEALAESRPATPEEVEKFLSSVN